MSTSTIHLPTITASDEKRFDNLVSAYDAAPATLRREHMNELRRIFKSSYGKTDINSWKICSTRPCSNRKNYYGENYFTDEEHIIHKWIMLELHHDYDYLIWGKTLRGRKWRNLGRGNDLNELISSINKQGLLITDMKAFHFNTKKMSVLKCKKIIEYSV